MKKIGRMAMDLGLVQVSGDIPTEAGPVLAEKARLFLRAGGVLDWSTWLLFSPEEQGIFAAVGEAVARERASYVLDAAAELAGTAGKERDIQTVLEEYAREVAGS